MNYSLITDVIRLTESFELASQSGSYTADINGFRQWIMDTQAGVQENAEPYWEGKEKGRSPESAISTLLVHMNRYAKSYSRSAIYGSEFSTQEEFFYLINLKAYGAMSKMKLIRKNIQDKPTGMQIINRLLNNGWIAQQPSSEDRRSKVVDITPKGEQVLQQQMGQIRQATQVVSGDLSRQEKMELIRLLNRLDHFHKPIFEAGIESAALLERVTHDFMPTRN
ncbi:MarR family winged helix-turn-helix transcriptional regulator [Niabella hibiscisoli]|uniref:MarR family winged helix-turn-helix transcriptional regulator n=1 Tax=Niabella hibiscisoli TaxID=1825928 RepID=UPI001F1114B4|nr:MarR family transcriptional regulator [Niabella hibiscisoli]MCH5718597.1 MarR family transcriptional regulator [Niabella hibiscisoli]